MRKIYAFVFARGGSKGLPKKNLKQLNGIPLLGYSINIAKEVEQISSVFVSTEDDEIASVALEFGAEVIKRPSELSSDHASEWLAWQHAVSYLRKLGHDFDVFVSLPTTSPLRDKSDVIKCINALNSNCDSVITTTASNRSPYFNMVSRNEAGFLEVVCSDKKFNRRQDVPKVYDITTVCYVTTPNFIENNGNLFNGMVQAVDIPKKRALDIDDEHDFKLAQLLVANKKLRNGFYDFYRK